MQILKAGSFNKNGFTLIELSVVILLLGIIISIVYPKIDIVTPKKRLKTTANMFAGIIKQLHSKSALTKQVFRLNYDISSGEYWITVLSPIVSEGKVDKVETYIPLDNQMQFINDNSIVTYKSKLKKGIAFKDIIKTDIGKVVEGETFTEFLPTGQIESTTIHLQGEDKDIFTLIIKPLSGRIKVFNRYVEETPF